MSVMNLYESSYAAEKIILSQRRRRSEANAGTLANEIHNLLCLWLN